MQRLKVEFIRTDTRGSLIQVNTDNWKQLNHLILNKNQKFGEHYHKHKKELFYMIKGKLEIRIIDKQGGKNFVIERTGGYITIEPYDFHTLYALEDCEIIELLSRPFDEKDVWTE